MFKLFHKFCQLAGLKYILGDPYIIGLGKKLQNPRTEKKILEDHSF